MIRQAQIYLKKKRETELEIPLLYKARFKTKIKKCDEDHHTLIKHAICNKNIY